MSSTREVAEGMGVRTLKPQEPPASWSMKFCTGCGRNDLVRSLSDRHYWSGERCEGTIVTVRYQRVDGNEREAERR